MDGARNSSFSLWKARDVSSHLACIACQIDQLTQAWCKFAVFWHSAEKLHDEPLTQKDGSMASPNARRESESDMRLLGYVLQVIPVIGYLTTRFSYLGTSFVSNVH